MDDTTLLRFLNDLYGTDFRPSALTDEYKEDVFANIKTMEEGKYSSGCPFSDYRIRNMLEKLGSNGEILCPKNLESLQINDCGECWKFCLGRLKEEYGIYGFFSDDLNEVLKF